MHRILLVLAALLAPATAAAQWPERPVTRIVFASCFDQRPPGEPAAWGAMFAYRPDVFIALGDNVYGDVRAAAMRPDVPELAAAYAQARAQGHFHRMARSAQMLATWDDHDFGINDGGAEHPYRERAKELFLDFFEIAADDVRRTRPGIHFSRVIGPPGQRVQIILLDTRWWRSPLVRGPLPAPFGPYVPTEDRTTTLLGEEQWAWLAERLREPAELRLVVSSIQLVADGHGWERWGNFPHERARFYRLLAETRAEGVVVLSGDRHIGGIYRHAEGVPYPVIDVTASPIVRPFPGNREPGPNRVGAIYGLENFGTVDIDWWERRVALSIRSVNGEPVRRIELAFDELRAR
jgi:alkaline phosphatase D